MTGKIYSKTKMILVCVATASCCAASCATSDGQMMPGDGAEEATLPDSVEAESGTSDADGGADMEADGTCRPTGPEVCDGIDNDCNGIIDDAEDCACTNDEDCGDNALCGHCGGTGSCVYDTGADCGTCAVCNDSGNCIYDSSQNGDCGFCQKCSGIGTCTDQTGSEDIKGDCSPDSGCGSGNCDGSGACEYASADADCGTCKRCDGSGSCAGNSSDHDDCPMCQKCSSGSCINQSRSEDLKDECSPGTSTDDGCAADTCSGSGSWCGVIGTGDGACPVCQRCVDADVGCENYPREEQDDGCSGSDCCNSSGDCISGCTTPSCCTPGWIWAVCSSGGGSTCAPNTSEGGTAIGSFCYNCSLTGGTCDTGMC